MTVESKPTKPMVRVVLDDDHAVVHDGIRQLFEQAADIQVIGEDSDGDNAVHTTPPTLIVTVQVCFAMPSASSARLIWLKSVSQKPSVAF